MKKKIAILGSTGSIGKTTIDIIKKDIDNFVNSIDRAWKILDFDRVEDQYFPVNILKT